MKSVTHLVSSEFRKVLSDLFEARARMLASGTPILATACGPAVNTEHSTKQVSLTFYVDGCMSTMMHFRKTAILFEIPGSPWAMLGGGDIETVFGSVLCNVHTGEVY